MNFVAALPFASVDEQTRMLERFHYIKDPKPSHDLPALAIMMRKPNSDELFVHDTLYNIEITKARDGNMVMRCWTGDMQLTLQDEISSNQAKGKTVITLDN